MSNDMCCKQESYKKKWFSFNFSKLSPNKWFRKIICALGYHRIEGSEGGLLGQHNEWEDKFCYFLICKDCHYHIANIIYKERKRK